MNAAQPAELQARESLARRIIACLAPERCDDAPVDARDLVVESLTGGASSLTYLVRQGRPGHSPRAPDACRFVVKIAPPGLLPTGHRDVLRQARLLDAVHGVNGVRVPRVLFSDGGDPPATQPFFAMSFQDGQSHEPHVDALALDAAAPSPLEIRSRALHAVDMLAGLHRIATSSVPGVEAPMTPQGEVERWLKALRTVPQHAGLRVEGIAARLTGAAPSPLPVALTHGDYRLGNMLCRGESVEAIIDWELWGVGDPRFDLGWMRLSANAGAHPLAVRSAPGMPAPQEILSRYEAASGARVGGIAWFDAVALFKMAAAIALIVKHRQRKGIVDESTQRLADSVPYLLGRVERDIEQF